MFKDIYATLPCSSYNMQTVKAAIRAAGTYGVLRHAQLPDGKDIVHGVFALTEDKSVPVFAHPIIFDNGTAKDEIVIDARGYTRIDKSDSRLVISNNTDYEFAVLRARLQWAWVHNLCSEMATLGALPAMVFARWISENLSRRLNTTPQEQRDIAILAAIYYHCLFYDQVSEDEMIKIATQAARATSATVDEALKITDQLKNNPMLDVISFISAMKIIAPSSRVDAITPAFLYATLRGSWWGAHAAEIVAVSLEHPPTFLTIVYMALTSRTYYKSFMAQLVDKLNRQNLGKYFAQAMDNFLASLQHE